MNDLLTIPEVYNTEATAFRVEFVNQAIQRSTIDSQLPPRENLDLTEEFDIPQFAALVEKEWRNFLENSTDRPQGDTYTSMSYPGTRIDAADEKIRIVFNLVKRMMGSFSQDEGKDKHFSSIKTFRPIYLGTTKDPKYPSHTIHIFAQRFENEVGWLVTGKSAPEVQEWAFLFERFLMDNSYKWVKHGLISFRYMGMVNGREIEELGGQKDPQMLEYGYEVRCWAPTLRWSRVIEKDLETFYLKLRLSENDTLQDEA